MPTVQFSAAEVAQLKQEVQGGGAGLAAPALCHDWPAAKAFLEALLALIPNPIAKGAIGVVIAAGNAICGGG